MHLFFFRFQLETTMILRHENELLSVIASEASYFYFSAQPRVYIEDSSCNLMAFEMTFVDQQLKNKM